MFVISGDEVNNKARDFINMMFLGRRGGKLVSIVEVYFLHLLDGFSFQCIYFRMTLPVD